MPSSSTSWNSITCMRHKWIEISRLVWTSPRWRSPSDLVPAECDEDVADQKVLKPKFALSEDRRYDAPCSIGDCQATVAHQGQWHSPGRLLRPPLQDVSGLSELFVPVSSLQTFNLLYCNRQHTGSIPVSAIISVFRLVNIMLSRIQIFYWPNYKPKPFATWNRDTGYHSGRKNGELMDPRTGAVLLLWPMSVRYYLNWVSPYEKLYKRRIVIFRRVNKRLNIAPFAQLYGALSISATDTN